MVQTRRWLLAPYAGMALGFALSCGSEGASAPSGSVSAVVVTPAAANLTAIGDTVRFVATARDRLGNPVDGRRFTWTSSDRGVARVDAGGLAIANANGSTLVRANTGGIDGQASLVVAQAVASLLVAPRTVSLGTTDTARLTATLLDANGALATAAVSWTSTAGAVASVDSDGLVAGLAVGTAIIRATSGAASDSATVTVSTSPATIFFEEGFEDADLASRGWYDLAGTPTITSTDQLSGVGALEVAFNQGATTPGTSARHAFPEAASVYLSYWIRYSTNWVGSGDPFHPHEFYFLTNQNDAFSGLARTRLTAYVEHNYQVATGGGVPVVEIQDAQNIDLNNIGVDLTGVTEARAVAGCNGDSDGYPGDCFSTGGGTYLNGKTWRATQAAFRDAPGPGYKNDWHFVEAYFELNTVQGGIGVPDGVIRYWIDGQLVIDLTDVLLRTGAYPNMRFNQFIFAPFIGSGSPVAQTMWVDDLRVADRRP